MSKLALFGGEPVRKEPFPRFNNIGEEEKKAVMEVLDSGILSDFIAHNGEYFLGGKKVREFEENFQKKFKVKFAVSVNSATTGLQAALTALGVGPGDEVIVTPITMSATVSAILTRNAIPIFVDVDQRTLNLDPSKIEGLITDKTKAIIVVSLWGHSADLDPIMEIARKHNLYVLEDNAQCPGGTYKGRFVGTIGHIGVFSFNFHKIIHSGEGGVVVTNDDKLAFRARLARNHGDVVVDAYDDERRFEHVLGSNYRMTEMEAAVANEQIKKLDGLTDYRIELADYLSSKLKEIDGVTPTYLQDGVKHVYYIYSMHVDHDRFGMTKKAFLDAMNAEGMPVWSIRPPLYTLPIYQSREVYNKTMCPFECKHYGRKIEYKKGLCPAAERMYEKSFIIVDMVRNSITKKDIDEFVIALKKVLDNAGELKDYARGEKVVR